MSDEFEEPRSKLFLYIVAVALVIAGAVSVPFLLKLDRYRDELVKNLKRRLNREVVIGKLQAGAFPPALHLQEVAVMDRLAQANPPVFRATRVDVPLNLGALLRAKVVPQSLNFQDWSAVLRRTAGGSWEWEDWALPMAQLGDKSGWPLKRVDFGRGECRAADPFGAAHEDFVAHVAQASWDLSRHSATASADLADLPVPVKAAFQGQGRFFPDPQWSGSLQLTEGSRQWTLQLSKQGDKFEANGRSNEWRLDVVYALVRFYSRLPMAAATASPVALQGWESHWDWQGENLNFTQAASVSEGRAEIKGSVVSKTAGPSAHVEAAFQGVQIRPIEMIAWGNGLMEGAATGLARLDVALSSSPWSGVNGQGALELKNGRYFWPAASIQSLSKAHMMRYLLKKFPGFPQEGLRFVKASGHWQARGGVFFLDDGFCNVGDIRMALSGKFDGARRGGDAFLLAQGREPDAGLRKEISPSRISGSQILPMYGHVQGSLTDWHARAVPSSKIPSAALAKLRKAAAAK